MQKGGREGCATTSRPPASAGPLVDLIGSEDKQELRLDAGSFGLMVGRIAARNTLPVVINFLKQRSEAVS